MRDGPGSLRYRFSLGLACAMVAISSACEDPSAGGPGPDESGAEAAVRDSAGVVIVEHGRIDLAGVPEWRLAAEPELEIGRVAGDARYLLHEVRDAIRRDDRSVVVIVGNEVRAFGPGGSFLWSQGREGRGPGAYLGAFVLAPVRGDSIVVWDHGLRRFSVLSGEGEFGRLVTLPPERYPLMLGAAGPDALIIQELASDPRPDAVTEQLRVHRQRLIPTVVGLDGERTHSWGPLATNRLYRYSWASTGAPWNTGASIVPARDDLPGVWLGDGQTPVPEVRLLRPAGRVDRIVRWESDRRVTEADREEYRRWYLDEVSEIEHRERQRSYRAILDLFPWPDRFPAYDRLLTDGAGRVWVAEYLREDRVEDDDLQRWTIFSADGRRVLGWYAAPQRWEWSLVKDVGEDWMLVVERDELEVERLRLYRILQGG